MNLISAMFGAVRRRRSGQCDDEGFALIFSLVLITMVSVLSLTVAGVVLSQAQPTGFQRKEVRTINAANAGLQVALNKLRAANDGSGAGVISALPCSTSAGATYQLTNAGSVTVRGATYAGQVSTNPGALGYVVSIAYFNTDPSKHDTDPTWLQNNALSCPLTLVPAYAYVQSLGSGAAVPTLNAAQGNRAEHATYQFSTSNINVAGGRIREYGTNLCLDAGSSPTAGITTLKMNTCLAVGTPQQMWIYRPDLTIYYGGNPSLNLCLQAVPGSSSLPTLQTCTTAANVAGSTTYPYSGTAAQQQTQQQQEWSYDDNGHFASATSSGGVSTATGSPYCLAARSSTASSPGSNGDDLILSTSCGGGPESPLAWNPDPEVGAGKAGGNITGMPGAPTKQFVNYKEFGRCLDITGQNVDADHLIDYPCKQSPDTAQLAFNQVWAFTGSGTTAGTMSVTKSGTKYCLTAPTSGDLVTTTVCAAGNMSQTWTATGNVQGAYSTSFELVSSSGQCLGVTPTRDSAAWSWIVVATCDGTDAQKWNAPPNPPATNVSNIKEDSGGIGS